MIVPPHANRLDILISSPEESSTGMITWFNDDDTLWVLCTRFAAAAQAPEWAMNAQFILVVLTFGVF